MLLKSLSMIPSTAGRFHEGQVRFKLMLAQLALERGDIDLAEARLAEAEAEAEKGKET